MRTYEPYIKQDFEIVKGTDLDLPFEWEDDDGSPLDLSGWNFFFSVRWHNGDTPVLITPTIVDNKTTFHIDDPVHAWDWDCANYVFTYEKTDGVKRSALIGKLKLVAAGS